MDFTKQSLVFQSECLLITTLMVMIMLSFNEIYKREHCQHETETAMLSFRILAFNRPESLQRLFHSLSNLHIKKNTKGVNLYIYVDSISKSHYSQREMNSFIRVREATQSFPWTLGKKEIHYRTVHHGLRNQWLAAWYPSNEKEASIFLEDDIEVSSRFLEYVEKMLAAIERVNKSSRVHEEFEQCGGIITEDLRISDYYSSLNSKINQSLHCFRVRFTSSWAPIYFSTFWKHFVDWYWTVTLKPNYIPYTEGKYNVWLREGKDVWSPWLRKFLDETDYWFIHCKPPNQNTVWLRNYADIGANTHSYHKTTLPELFSGDVSPGDVSSFQVSKYSIG